MRRTSSCSLLILALGSAVRPAVADDETPAPHQAGYVAIAGHAGAGTPLGYFGVSVEADLAEWIVLSAGVGMGMDSFSGTPYPQVATMARVRVPSGSANHFELGVGASRGAYTWNELTFDEPAHKTWAHANWLNIEIGYEHQVMYARQTLAFRVYAGFGQILNPDDYVCSDEHCLMDHQDDGERSPYVGASMALRISRGAGM